MESCLGTPGEAGGAGRWVLWPRGCLSCLCCLALETQKTNHGPCVVPSRPAGALAGLQESTDLHSDRQEGVLLKWFVVFKLLLIYLMSSRTLSRQILHRTPLSWAEWFSVQLPRAVLTFLNPGPPLITPYGRDGWACSPVALRHNGTDNARGVSGARNEGQALDFWNIWCSFQPCKTGVWR